MTTRVDDFGANAGDMVFPSLQPANSCLNDIPLHPNIVGSAAQLLGVDVDDIRLSQCELWTKSGGVDPANVGPDHR